MTNYISGSAEIVRVAEAVATEKGIAVEAVIDAIEQGVKTAARRKYGADYDINVTFNRKTGELKILRRIEVVETVEDPQTQISLKQAQESVKDDASIKIGDFVTQNLPPVDMKRLVAQIVKQVISQKVKFAEREKQYDQFKDKVGTIINGVVKKVSGRGVLLDVGNVEAFLDRNDSISHETLKQNDRVRACIKEVIRKDTGVQIYLSRTSNEFMEQLFMQEVPEIYDGIIKIKAIAREPGIRAKIAVQAIESNLDPVGACVGVRGSRVQVVINELKGEKIDIIEWSEEPSVFVVNALVPAQILKVVIDEDNQRIETVVPQKDYSLAIGRRGQNARLASRLTGWNIDILTEEDEANIRKEELEKIYNIFVGKLGLEDMLARVLIAEDLTDLEEILEVTPEQLATVEGFDEKAAADLIGKTKKFIKTKDYKLYKWDALELDKQLLEVKHLDLAIALTLKNSGVKTLQALADLSRDEFRDFVAADAITDKKTDELIMSARELLEKTEQNKEAS